MHWRRQSFFSPVSFGAFFFVCICLWYILTLPPLPLASKTDTRPSNYEVIVRGAFHVHTNRSDGSGSVMEIARVASEAGLDFLIFTDHGDGSITLDPPRFIDNVLCIDAVEISTDGGHYIALGLPSKSPYPLGGESKGVVDDVRRLGGFGVVAHPFSPKIDLQWTDSLSEIDGIEILNGDSQWRDEGIVDLLLAGAYSLVRPSSAFARLLDRPTQNFEHWDRLGGKRRVVGLSGGDVHARIAFPTSTQDHGDSRAIGFPFPRYKDVFNTFSTRVLLQGRFSNDPKVAAGDLINNLKKGRVFTVTDGIAELRHFSFTARKSGQIYQMGEAVIPGNDISLHSKITGPGDLELVLLRNGVPVLRTKESTFNYLAGPEPAVYRIEVFVLRDSETDLSPWVISNPIYVGEHLESLSSPSSLVMTEHLFGANHWHIEHSSDESTGTLEAREDYLSFRYALDSASQSNSFVAAVYDNPALDLDRATSVSFDVYGDRPIRLFLQLRASELENQPRWIRSFYVDPSKRKISIDLESLLPVEPSQSSRVKLESVDSVLFVADLTNHSPGDRGLVELSDIRTVINQAR